MIANLKQKVLGQKKVAGIEAVFSAEGKTTFNCVILSVKENLVQIEHKEEGFEDVKTLKTLSLENVPLVLSVTGRGILHKKIKDEYTDDIHAFSQIFPNSNFRDYYLQKAKAYNNQIYISLIRKGLIDQLLLTFKEAGCYVTSLTLGPFSVADLNPLLSMNLNELSFGNHELFFEKGLVDNYKIRESNDYSIVKAGDEAIPGSLLIAYASAFLGIIEYDCIRTEIAEVDRQRDEWEQKKKFKLIGFSLLAVFLSALLINTYLFTNYNQENQLLTLKLGRLNDISVNLEEEENELHQKEVFLSQAGWLYPAKSSYYSDQIAALLPASITLTKMAKNPFNEKESRSQRKEVFDNGILRVDGFCAKPTELNSWIKIMKDQNWVHDAHVEDYTFDSKTELGNFTVQIKIKGELE
jgi:Tfp pilus assembly protein PilN